MEPYQVDFDLGSLFLSFFLSSSLNFPAFPRQMFKRLALRGLADSVERSSCSLRLTQELIIRLLLFAGLFFFKFKAIGVDSCGFSDHSFRSGGATQLQI